MKINNYIKINHNETPPVEIKNFIETEKTNKLLSLYNSLPLTVHNKKQNVIKKRWFSSFNLELEKWYIKKLEEVIGKFHMDNLFTEDKKEILGLFQESYSPIGLHVDSGFDNSTTIYKQVLIPLSDYGSTIIFKNRYHKGSTTFTLDEEELKIKNLKYGQNVRSNEHLKLYGGKPFDKSIHKKYLAHEKIENLAGLEIEYIFKWKIGSILIFDRTHLHSSSSQIKNKKIGLTTFTKK